MIPVVAPFVIAARRSLSRLVRALRLLLVLLAGLAPAALPAAEPDGGLVVIGHPDLRVKSIDGEEIRRLFLGKSRTLPNGARAELASYGPETSFFNERVLDLSDAQVATIWSRLRFSGRTPPPQVFDSAEAVVDFVADTPNAIAYVPANVSRDGVRVYYSVPR